MFEDRRIFFSTTLGFSVIEVYYASNQTLKGRFETFSYVSSTQMLKMIGFTTERNKEVYDRVAEDQAKMQVSFLFSRTLFQSLVQRYNKNCHKVV